MFDDTIEEDTWYYNNDSYGFRVAFRCGVPTDSVVD